MSKRYTSDKPIKVLYEDEQFMAFYKPAGLLSVASGAHKQEENCLEDMVNEFYREEVDGVPGPKLHPCHRLDRETSGVIFFAKGKMNQQLLMDLFHKKLVHKRYIAFVHGRVTRPAGTIRIPVKDAFADKFSPDSEAKEAATKYKVLEIRTKFSILEAEPITGRTNQLFSALAGGAGALMEKPLNFPKLLQTVRALLSESPESMEARSQGRPAQFHFIPPDSR